MLSMETWPGRGALMIKRPGESPHLAQEVREGLDCSEVRIHKAYEKSVCSLMVLGSHL